MMSCSLWKKMNLGKVDKMMDARKIQVYLGTLRLYDINAVTTTKVYSSTDKEIRVNHFL